MNTTQKKYDLYRLGAETRDQDISWSSVGPGHERAYFSVLPLAGYASDIRSDAYPYYVAPFHIYTMGNQKLPARNCATAAAAKRAVRAWLNQWIKGEKKIVWEAADTGVHFYARVDGIEISTVYYSTKEDSSLGKGLRAWFGGTYYVTPIADLDEAKLAVAASWAIWLEHTRKCLFARLNRD
jgi:hypothetical protein